jgi:antitoxin (DNA-binding transcriptional repressor) of toxin-antitoxin stability system
MKEISAAQFKEQCLTLLDNLDADGLIITKNGKPVACVIPLDRNNDDISSSSHGELIGSLRDKVKINGDLLTTGCQWDANARS